MEFKIGDIVEGEIIDFTHEGISVSKTKESQLNKTFELLINDFKKYVNNKG